MENTISINLETGKITNNFTIEDYRDLQDQKIYFQKERMKHAISFAEKEIKRLQEEIAAQKEVLKETKNTYKAKILLYKLNNKDKTTTSYDNFVAEQIKNLNEFWQKEFANKGGKAQ